MFECLAEEKYWTEFSKSKVSRQNKGGHQKQKHGKHGKFGGGKFGGGKKRKLGGDQPGNFRLHFSTLNNVFQMTTNILILQMPSKRSTLNLMKNNNICCFFNLLCVE